MTTADVGNLGSSLQLGFDTIECRNPARGQIGVVAGPEEALRAREQALRMLVPADALAGTKSLGDLRLV